MSSFKRRGDLVTNFIRATGGSLVAVVQNPDVIPS